MSKRHILVVDDDPYTLENLVENLKKDHHVVGCSSGEEAVQLVEANPGDFEFVVVDHLLNHGISGIETARRISTISDDIFILVFTNVPAADMETLERHRSDAFEAGAHRYMERAASREQPWQVQEFVEEMEQLSKLRERIGDFFDERRNVPSLLTQLDLGVDIVDRSYKLWYMNQAMRRITGYEGLGLPRERCMFRHGYDLCPCPGCPVEKAFERCKPDQSIFLSPIPRRGNKLFYFLVWVQPVVDEEGQVMTTKDGKPLAIMETVQELNGTESLRAMSFDTRLEIIATALHQRLRNGFRRIRPFTRVAIYALESLDATTNQLVLRAIAGYEKHCNERIGAPFNPQAVSGFNDVIQSTKTNGWGTFFEDGGRLDLIDSTSLPKCIDWPVVGKDGRLVAFVRTGGENCSKADLEIMRAYAEEVLAAFEESTSAKRNSVTPEAEQRLAAIDNQLQTMRSPEDALRFLIEQGCEFTGSYSGHLRERRGNDVVILRLGPRGYDAYEHQARAAWPLTHRASWSARTVLAGTEQMWSNLADVKDQVRSERLSQEAVGVLETAQSCCFEPLVFENRCIGAIGFHSTKQDNYSEDRLWFLRQIARRASLALYDMQRRREAEERLQSVRVDTVLLLLHNINNPLTVLWNRVELMRILLDKEPIDLGRCREVIEAFADGCRRISQVRKDLASLLRPMESSRTAINLHELIQRVVGELLGDRVDVQFIKDLSPHVDRVGADELAIRTCMQILVQNALDEFDKLGSDRQHVLTVSLRDAGEDEAARIATRGPSLVIEVQDNGPGVPPEMEQNLFAVIRSPKSSGLGIGLAKCRGMARTAGGDAYLNRSVKTGAKFVLLMPYTHQGESND